MVRTLAEPVAQQNVVIVVRVALTAGGAVDVLGVDARVRVVRRGGGGGGFVVGVDGGLFGNLFGLRVRLGVLQVLEQLADAELGVEDLRARLRDLSRGAEFLAAASVGSRERIRERFRNASALLLRRRRGGKKRKTESLALLERRRSRLSRSKGHRSPRAFPPVHVVRLDHGELLANRAHLTRDPVLGSRELRRRRGREVTDRQLLWHRRKTNGEPSFVGTRSVPIAVEPSAEAENVWSVEIDRLRAPIVRTHLVDDEVVVPAFRAAAAAAAASSTTSSSASSATRYLVGFVLLRLGGVGDDRLLLSLAVAGARASRSASRRGSPDGHRELRLDSRRAPQWRLRA